MKKNIRITSSRQTEFSSHVVVAGKKYLVVTETSGRQNAQIASMVYLNGEIISKRKIDCGAPGNGHDMETFMRKQHDLAVNWLKEEKMKEARTPSDYLEDVKVLLSRKSPQEALTMLREALAQYPEEPFILSYYGSLTAIVERNHNEGIQACDRAFKTLRQRIPFGEEFFYPSLYLNLGRAYLAARRKKEAIETFRRGLHINRDNRELLTELKRLGSRRKCPVPFLQRSNPINKYTGILLYRLNPQR
jgi:tetratricopeptide (TPR) repeat protein